MSVLEQVALRKTQAVELLLSERDRIDAELAILGQEKAPSQKRRGRPPIPKPCAHSDTTDESDPSPLS